MHESRRILGDIIIIIKGLYFTNKISKREETRDKSIAKAKFDMNTVFQTNLNNGEEFLFYWNLSVNLSFHTGRSVYPLDIKLKGKEAKPLLFFTM